MITSKDIQALKEDQKALDLGAKSNKEKLMSISEKFIKKYMRLAKLVGEDSNPCLSRSIGVVIVNPQNHQTSLGYNGPPAGVPHCDDEEYLRDVVWQLLTDEEKEEVNVTSAQSFAKKYKDCGQCPRRIIGAPSGKRLEICSCQHAERNAIIKAAFDLHGCHMFCWCGVPCVDCTGAIVNAGIKKVYAIDWGADYSPQSRWLLRKAGVQLELRHMETIERVEC